MRLLASGKVKDIYEYDESHLLFRFSNRVSAYDVKFREEIPKKGEVLCKFAEYWFDKLPVKSHFVRRVSDTEIVVRRMEMVPIECVVRGYFYGSLAKRWKDGSVDVPEGTQTELAARLSEPIFDPTTKSEHDVPVTEEDALGMGLVTREQFAWLSSKSIEIFKRMTPIADSAGFILADLKLEFGFDGGEVVLGDSIGPDEYRLWPKDQYAVGRTQESYDKQILRDWLSEHGYTRQFDVSRDEGRQPVAPPIPDDMVGKMTQRYVEAYQRITGLPL